MIATPPDVINSRARVIAAADQLGANFEHLCATLDPMAPVPIDTARMFLRYHEASIRYLHQLQDWRKAEGLPPDESIARWLTFAESWAGEMRRIVGFVS